MPPRPSWPRVLSAALIAAAVSDARGQAPQRDPIVESAVVERGRGVFVASDDPPLAAPDHPPIDTLPPMPMPTRDAAARPPSSNRPGATVSFDLTTRRETRTPIDPETADPLPPPHRDFGRRPGHPGADAGRPNDERKPVRFSDLNLISPAQRADWPWRRNAKLVMRVGGKYYVCTGTMLDAEVVLTAAHCVYSTEDEEWIEHVWVYPGWDGESRNELSEHYGVAQGTKLFAVEEWTLDENHEYDVAEIVLQRAVGAVTGWSGWAHGGDCATITSRTYGSASYPAESCGSSLHTGRDMYYWSGQFDSCLDDDGDGIDGLLRIDNGGTGCLSTLWGGMSGSSAFYTDDGEDYAHAVASHSRQVDGVTINGNYTKLSSGWQTAIHDPAVAEARGSAFDLQPLNVEVESTAVAPGDRITVTHLAANPTDEPKSGRFRFGIHLSANDNVDLSDTLLDTHAYDWDFGGMDRVRLTSRSVGIPADTPPGDYFLGVVYESETDSFSDNNDTDGWDAARLRVTRTTSVAPDLVVEAATASKTSLASGETFTLSATVRNRGDGAAEATTLTYRRRRPGGTWVTEGTDSVDRLLPSGTSRESIDLTAPAQAGTHDYGACVSTAGGERETANNCSEAVRINVCAVERLGSVALTRRVVGSWVRGCESTHRPRSYARYYSFVLTRAAEVGISLTASSNTYLFLLAGRGTSGRVLASNDDIGAGELNSRIVTRLSAGTYTVEATTFGAGLTGSFTLRVGERRPFGDPVVTGRPIKAAHLTELRARIDDLRVSAGLPRYSWADRTIRAGATPVRAMHWNQLRTALDQVYEADGRRPPAYTDSIRVGAAIEAEHVNELRRAVQGL